MSRGGRMGTGALTCTEEEDGEVIDFIGLFERKDEMCLISG